MAPGDVLRTERVYLLVSSPDATGGIARSAAGLANALAGTHTVEVIGLQGVGQDRHYPLDDRIKVTCLVEEVAGTELRMDSLPTGLVDVLLPETLRDLEPGFVISTRPVLHAAAARHAPAHCVLVGQDHMNLEFRRRNSSLQHIEGAIDRLDQFVVLTEADAADYRALFPRAADRIRVIPNAAPWPILQAARPRRPIIVGAGQLSRRKGFDRLIDAFVPIAARYPEWRTHIYGEGPRLEELDQQISDRGLRGRVVLKGRTDNMETVLEEAAVFALTSRHEGLPMVLIEAMTKGVPVVSFDCPRGPAEIVVDGVTGRLVEDGDVDGFSAALLALVGDDDLRRRMSHQASQHAQRYQTSAVMQSWYDLLDDLARPSTGRDDAR